MKALFLSVLLFISVTGIAQVTEHANNQNVFTVSSINPSDTSYNDLSFFKKVLSNNQVLLLGEKAHGEGTFTLAKTRMINYLVKNLGYNTIVFESGFFDACYVGKTLNNNNNPDKIYWAAFPYILYNTKEFGTLKTWLEKKLIADSVKLCGMDNQLGAVSYNMLIPYISTALKEFDFTLDTSSVELIKKYIWQNKGSENNYFESPSDSITIYNTLNDMLFFSRKVNNDTDNIVHQSVKNLKALMNQNINVYYSKPMYYQAGERDRQMADNLFWIIRHKLPNDKIIIWTASMHCARNINTLKDVSDTAFYHNYIPMGQILHDSLGDKMFSVSFTASTGYYQTPYMMKDSVEIISIDSTSIESYFKKRNIKYGFANLKGVKKGYFSKPLYSNPFGNSNAKAIWPEVFDGVFYVDTIHPPTLIKR